MDRLAALLWENIPSENLIFKGYSKLEERNLEDLPIDLLDELYISRDDRYDIKITCIRKINRFNDQTHSRKKKERGFLAGETVNPGEVIVRPFGDSYSILFAPCYYSGCVSTLDSSKYQLSCYHIECKYSEKPITILKEWILNGSQSGLRFCANQQFNYTVESAVFGKYGDFEFPIKDSHKEMERVGNFVHFKFRDTAFDVHYVGNDYGPTWSENLSISYFEKYGRIPSAEERIIIREYLSFIVGTRLLYIGNSTFDDNGNQLGFEMESPNTYSFEIERICKNAAMPPICDKYDSLNAYFDFVQKYLEPFADLYTKLDFNALFGSYWYAKNMAKPYDLPILSGSLEYLMKKWYEQVELNPETILIDKKEFKNRIKPIKNLTKEQFKDTEFADRMQHSIDGMNRMTINEMMWHFFDKIGMPIGETEKKALQARNLSAHGSFRVMGSNYSELYKFSKVYECIITRTVLILLGYAGKYVDYGILGFPEKDVKVPSGDIAIK